jgi:NAD(P)H-hydrate epimerase
MIMLTTVDLYPITSQEMRAIDLNAQYLGVSDTQLMENAGAAVAREVAAKAKKGSKVIVLAGTGGNGGDGMVAARHLAGMGYKVYIWLLGDPLAIIRGDVRGNWETLGLMPDSIKTTVVKDSALLPLIEADVVVDALLGTGAKGVLRPPILQGVKAMNKAAGLKIAVDIPTGLDSDSGEIQGEAFKADSTITFHRPKKGLVLKQRRSIVGQLVVAEIGVPPEAEEHVGPGDVYLASKPRLSQTHKGDHGRVLVIGGSEDFHGAPTLAALAALGVGVDLVYVAVPEHVAHEVASASPDLIVIRLRGRNLSMENLDQLRKWVSQASAVVFGPGLGLEEKTRNAVKAVVEEVEAKGRPLLLDADGLKAFSEFKRPLNCPLVVTPHAGEYAILTGQKLSEGIEDRVKEVSNTAKRLGCVVVVKSPIDIISDGSRVKLNRFVHNPGMTVGGTGDILSGIIGALMSQGIEPFRASAAGVYINGAAGDYALDEKGYHLSATDLLRWIPKVMNDPAAHTKVRHH